MSDSSRADHRLQTELEAMSLSELIAKAKNDTETLAKQEVELASERAAATVGLLIRGLILVTAALMLLTQFSTLMAFSSAEWLIYFGMSRPLAYMVTALGFAVLAGILIFWAIKQFKGSKGAAHQIAGRIFDYVSKVDE